MQAVISEDSLPWVQALHVAGIQNTWCKGSKDTWKNTDNQQTSYAQEVHMHRNLLSTICIADDPKSSKLKSTVSTPDGQITGSTNQRLQMFSFMYLIRDWECPQPSALVTLDDIGEKLIAYMFNKIRGWQTLTNFKVAAEMLITISEASKDSS